MSIFRRFVAIFVSPYQVFDEIRESKVGWWQPWLIVSGIFILTIWLAAPVQQVMMEMNPQFENEDMSGKTGFMTVFQMVMAPAAALLITGLVAGISYVMVTLMSKEATFKKYFALLLFANIVFSVGYLFSTVLVRMRGVENITSMEDAQLSLSLRMLAGEGGPFLRGLLGSIEFFSIWGLVLIAIGLCRTFGMRTGQAVACVIPLWVMYAGLSIGSEFMAALQG